MKEQIECFYSHIMSAKQVIAVGRTFMTCMSLSLLFYNDALLRNGVVFVLFCWLESKGSFCFFLILICFCLCCFVFYFFIQHPCLLLRAELVCFFWLSVCYYGVCASKLMQVSVTIQFIVVVHTVNIIKRFKQIKAKKVDFFFVKNFNKKQVFINKTKINSEKKRRKLKYKNKINNNVAILINSINISFKLK